MLGMDIDQSVGERLQFLQGHHAVIHKRTTLAVSVQFSSYDALVKLRLDDALVLAVRDRFAVRSGTQHQGQGAKYDTLTRARLAGHDREARLKIYIQSADQGIILYV